MRQGPRLRLISKKRWRRLGRKRMRLRLWKAREAKAKAEARILQA